MAKMTFKNVSKHYGSKNVLKNINLEVENKFLFLAGKNGSGKTTFIKCALDILALNEGEILYDDKKMDKVRNDVSVVFDEPKLYMDFTGRKNIDIFDQGYLKDRDGVEDILECLELSDELLKRKVRTYSLGQRHRLAVAVALIKRPRYIFLDEPTIGLDPVSWGLVKRCLVQMQRDNGMTAVITGQDYEEMETLCQAVAVLHKGKIVVHSDIKKLIESYPKKVSFEYTGNHKLTDEKISMWGAKKLIEDNRQVVLEVPRKHIDICIDSIYQLDKPMNLKVEDYTLKEIFLDIVEKNGGNRS